MALPLIKATGNSRTLVFSGDISLQAKSRTCNIWLPTCVGSHGKDHAVFTINYDGSLDPGAPACAKTYKGGNSCNAFAVISNNFFKITATLIQDWEHARPYDVSVSLTLNRPKYSIRLKVEIINPASGLLATVYDDTDIEFDSSQISDRTIEGSFSIEMDVLEVIRWLSFDVPSTGVSNPFDAAISWPSRALYYEERFSGTSANLRWEVTFGDHSTSGSRSFSSNDTNDASIRAQGPSDYGLKLEAGVSGTLLEGIPLVAKVDNVICANWTSFGWDGQVYNIFTNTWVGGAGHYAESAIVGSDCAPWEAMHAGQQLYNVITDVTEGISCQFQGEAYYSQPTFNSGAGRYDIGQPTLVNRGYKALAVRLSPPLRFRINGVCKQFADPYTNAVRFFTNLNTVAYFYNTGAGTFSQKITAQQIELNGFASPTLSPSSDRRLFYNAQAHLAPFYCSLDGTHAATFGEDGNDTRASFFTKAFDAATVEAESEITHDNFNATTGWAGTNATLSSGGTSVTITGTAGSASATRTYSPKLNTETKRFLLLRAKFNRVSTALTLELNGGKKWTLQTGAINTFTDIVIDTMLPDIDQGSGSNHKDNRWPCNSVSADEPTTEAKYQGVNRISTLKISGLASGDILELDSLIGYTDEFEKLEILCSDGRSDYVSGYVTDVLDCKRGALGITDGRSSLELAANVKSGASYLQRTLTQFIADGNKFLGWTWTELTATNILDSWKSANVTAPELGGGGWLWDSVSAAWLNYTSLDMASDQTIKASLMVELLKLYPGVGNPFTDEDFEDYDAETQLYCSHIFRGKVHGIVWNSSFRPVSGALIIAVETTGSIPAGSAISDAVGYFETSPPTRPFRGLSVSSGPNSLGTLSSGVYPRRKHRLGGIGQEQGIGNPWNLISAIGQYHRVGIKSGDVWHFRASFGTPAGGFEKEAQVTISGDCVHPRLVEDGRPVLYLAYVRTGSGLYLRASFDEGTTFGDETLIIANAYFTTVQRDALGNLVALGFVYNSGTSGPGKIKMRRKGPGDTSWSTAVNVKSAGSDLVFVADTFHLVPDGDGPGRWVAVWKIDGESDVSEWYSTDECATFKRVS